MRIASRPSHDFRRPFTRIESEGLFSRGDEYPSLKIRHVAADLRNNQKSSQVVFRCEGVPNRQHSSSVCYDFFVELDPDELLAGLASLPPDKVEAAVEKVLRSSAVARQEQWPPENPDGFSPRDCGWPTALEVSETANAIVRGLVTALSHGTAEPEGGPAKP